MFKEYNNKILRNFIKKKVNFTIQSIPQSFQMGERLLEYKKAALKAKKEGDKDSALQFLKIVKQFDIVIKMAENGENVDLSDMPPPPDQLKVSISSVIKI